MPKTSSNNVADDDITRLMDKYSGFEQFITWKPELRCPGCHRKFTHPGVLQKQSLDFHRYQEFLLQEKNGAKDSQNRCNECKVAPTTLVCQTCCLFFCKPCFNKLHMMTVSFANHQLQEIESLDEKLVEMINLSCNLHPAVKSYYCEDCNLLICSMCFTTSKHKSHKCEPMDENFEENRREMQDLMISLKRAKKLGEEMIKKIETANETNEKFVNDTKIQIHEHFNYLHGKLQIEEDELMQQLDTMKTKAETKTGEVKTVFDKIMKEINKKMQDLASFSPSKESYWKVALHVNLSECKKLLSKVPEEISFDFDKNPYTFIKNDNHKPSELQFCDTFGRFEIKSYLNQQSSRRSSIEGPTPVTQSASYKLPRLPHNLMSRQLSSILARKSSSSSILSFQEVSSDYKLVKLVNFISLEQMYVIPMEKFRIWTELTNDLKRAGSKQRATEIEINGLYLVKSNREWHRGRVLSTEQENQVSVYLVDIGETVKCRPKEVYVIPEAFSDNSDFLMRVAMMGIGPMDNFTELELFIDIVLMNHEAMMYIFYEENGTTYVDFIPKHEPCSIRSTLVRFGYAEKLEVKKRSSTTITSVTKKVEKQLEMMRKDALSFVKMIPRDDVFNAKIMNVVSPFEIYLIDYASYPELRDLEQDMANFYKVDNFNFFIPWMGRCCAVFYKDTYRRGKVIKDLTNGKFEVFLVDYGIKIQTNFQSMKHLTEEFYKRPVSYCCALKDVRPINDEVKWSNSSCNLLKTLLGHSVGKYEVTIHSRLKDKFEVTIRRLVGGIDGNTIYCVNTQLVTGEAAISCGPESQIETKTEITDDVVSNFDAMSESKEQKRHKTYGDFCVVTFVKSPSEFYIRLEKERHNLKDLEMKIQELMDLEDCQIVRGMDCVPLLNEGYCLVRASIANYSRFWMRGVIKNVSDDKFSVFLRDHGVTVDVTADELAQIPHEIQMYEDAAQKCRLAGLKPVAGLPSWTQTGIELFKNMVCKFDRVCVKMQGEPKDDDDAFPVVLYGVKVVSDDALAPEKHIWTQINENMVKNGVAHCVNFAHTIDSDLDETSEARKIHQEMFKDVIVDVTAQKSDLHDAIPTSSIYIETEPKQIDHWEPARELRKSLFSCTPTYVDADLNIYIQDNEFKNDIAAMKAEINRVVREIGEENFKRLPCDVNGLPCLVKYHVDKMFYRGKILKRDTRTDTYEVEFVDYGNKEVEILESEICIDVVAYNLPIYVHKVKLYGIIPKENSWSTEACDRVHYLVVDKACNIAIENQEDSNGNIIEPDDFKWCRIQTYLDNVNIANYLVENNYAVRSTAFIDPHVKVDPYYEPIELNLYNNSVNDSKISIDANGVQIIEEFVPTDGLDISRFEHLSVESFNPQETSSRFDPFEPRSPSAMIPATKNEIRSFPPFDRTHLPDKFYGIVLQITGPRTLEIQPSINSSRNYRAISRALESITLRKPLKTIFLRAPCLATCQARQTSGRAIISEVNEYEKTAEIHFIDFLKTETLPFEKLFECPEELQRIPVLWVSAEISNLKPNRHMRPKDLMKKMSETLTERYVYCVVKRINTVDPNEPIEMEIYDSEKSDRLAYESLINEKYFMLKSHDNY
ncbi:uncharacterized protein LOC134835793 isoform X2 [Culicoides brevitarsis]|uniref:uncharacterized protein LOC134835793 isoform X2 n=1 Tax=Culicoides brevitarsis TaxID=469753 RepID=UPI00307C0C76